MRGGFTENLFLDSFFALQVASRFKGAAQTYRRNEIALSRAATVESYLATQATDEAL